MEFLRNNPQMLLLGGLLLITMFFMSRLAKRRKRGPSSILSPHEQLERLKQARGMRGDLEQLMVEIEQMAKRMGAHLDAKSMRIERLLEEADQRIAKLEALQHADKSATHNQFAAADAQNDPTHSQNASPTNASIDTATFTSATQPVRPATPVAPAVDALPDDPLSRSVYELADQGIEPNQIARQLDEHVGKVELILALRSA